MKTLKLLLTIICVQNSLFFCPVFAGSDTLATSQHYQSCLEKIVHNTALSDQEKYDQLVKLRKDALANIDNEQSTELLTILDGEIVSLKNILKKQSNVRKLSKIIIPLLATTVVAVGGWHAYKNWNKQPFVPGLDDNDEGKGSGSQLSGSGEKPSDGKDDGKKPEPEKPKMADEAYAVLNTPEKIREITWAYMDKYSGIQAKTDDALASIKNMIIQKCPPLSVGQNEVFEPLCQKLADEVLKNARKELKEWRSAYVKRVKVELTNEGNRLAFINTFVENVLSTHDGGNPQVGLPFLEEHLNTLHPGITLAPNYATELKPDIENLLKEANQQIRIRFNVKRLVKLTQNESENRIPNWQSLLQFAQPEDHKRIKQLYQEQVGSFTTTRRYKDILAWFDGKPEPITPAEQLQDKKEKAELKDKRVFENIKDELVKVIMDFGGHPPDNLRRRFNLGLEEVFKEKVVDVIALSESAKYRDELVTFFKEQYVENGSKPVNISENPYYNDLGYSNAFTNLKDLVEQEFAKNHPPEQKSS